MKTLLTLMKVSGQLHVPDALPPEKKVPGTHWVGDWMDPKAGLEGGGVAPA
jgi:hypothetical protein